MTRGLVVALVLSVLCLAAFFVQRDYENAVFRFEPDPLTRAWSERAVMPTQRLSPRSDYTFASSEPLLFMDQTKSVVGDYSLGAGSTLPLITKKANVYLQVIGRPQGGRSVSFFDLVRDLQEGKEPDLASARTFFRERGLVSPRALKNFLYALQNETSCPSSKACAFYREVVRKMLLKHFVRARSFPGLPFSDRLEVEQENGEIMRVNFALM
jgi:hypothetical protein